MTPYEYHTIRIPNDEPCPTVKLDMFGRSGWEAYAVTHYKGGLTYHLKRPLPPKQPDNESDTISTITS